MNLKLFTLVGMGLVLLTGCVRTPVLMELPNNEEQSLYGEAVGGPIGNGSFEVSSLQGLSCKGTYNSLSQSRSLRVEFTCNDGRTGQAIITRSGTNLTNGSGTGELSDGQKVRILIGDVVHLRQGGY
ncbi:MAG: hypothetical protein AWU57_3628 [Marinobacter sp. T13-3]|jgi:hypothetical protein|nr:MAG: hypothetical protein AWU57_3628 [Marinobacter sp. T13-3]